MGLVHLDSEPRDARLEACRLERREPDEPTADLLRRCGQLVEHRGRGVRRHEEVESRETHALVFHQVELAERRVGRRDRSEASGGQQREQPQFADDFRGARSLHAEQPVVRRDVHDLDVLGDDVVFEAFREGLGEARFEIEQQLLRQRVDEGVGDETALRAAERRVATAACGEGLDVIGHLTVQRAHAVGAGEADAPAEAEVDDPGRGVQRRVLGHPIAVVGDRFLSVHLGEPGVEGGVDFVQRERSHRAGKLASDAAWAKDAEGPGSGEKPCPGRSAAERKAVSRAFGQGFRPGVRRSSGVLCDRKVKNRPGEDRQGSCPCGVGDAPLLWRCSESKKNRPLSGSRPGTRVKTRDLALHPGELGQSCLCHGSHLICVP